MLVYLSASTTNIFFKKSCHNYLTLSLTPKYTFCHFMSLLFLCRHPQKEVFVMLWYSFGDIFWNFGYQNLPTHTQTRILRLFKQMQTGRIPSVILFALTHTLHFNLRRRYIKCATSTITCLAYCGADVFCLQKSTWHFQLMCFKSTYFWDCWSSRALLAPAAPALHSNAWQVHCWKSLRLVSIYNNSWWVAVGTHLPVSWDLILISHIGWEYGLRIN